MIRATIARATVRAHLAISTALNRGIDSLIADMAKLDRRLDRHIATLEDRRTRLINEQRASLNRAAEFAHAERIHRDNLGVSVSDAEDEAARARRIRRRVAEFVS